MKVEIDSDAGLFSLLERTLIAEANDCWIATEVLNRAGVKFHENWQIISRGNEHKAVLSGGVLVSLSRTVDSDWIDHLFEFSPQTVVFLEDGFQGSDSLKTNAHFKFKQANITMKTI
jgi:hypothetical protein